MAKITKALAIAKISVLPFAAYSRDHIFVAEDDFEKAMQVLERLQQESKDETWLDHSSCPPPDSLKQTKSLKFWLSKKNMRTERRSMHNIIEMNLDLTFFYAL